MTQEIWHMTSDSMTNSHFWGYTWKQKLFSMSQGTILTISLDSLHSCEHSDIWIPCSQLMSDFQTFLIISHKNNVQIKFLPKGLQISSTVITVEITKFGGNKPNLSINFLLCLPPSICSIQIQEYGADPLLAICAAASSRISLQVQTYLSFLKTLVLTPRCPKTIQTLKIYGC